MIRRKERTMLTVASAVMVVLLFLLLFPQKTSAQNARKIIYVGDSRTVHMYETVTGVDVGKDLSDFTNSQEGWSAMCGMGYDWMVSTGVPRIEPYLDKNTNVVFLMGVNDYTEDGIAQEYASYINEKAAEWKEMGVITSFVSVNPVGSPQSPYYKGKLSNETIDAFNSQMKALLSDNVLYIDTYHEIITDYSTLDDLHFDADTSWRIYRKIKKDLAQATDRFNLLTGEPVFYPIHCELDGGTMIGQPSSYSVMSGTFHIPRPEKEGYAFEGWSMEEETMERLGMPGIGGACRQVCYYPEEVEVPAGSYGELHFTAVWKEEQ